VFRRNDKLRLIFFPSQLGDVVDGSTVVTMTTLVRVPIMRMKILRDRERHGSHEQTAKKGAHWHQYPWTSLK
jgi:hypothetical protein